MAGRLTGLFRLLGQSWPVAIPLPVLIAELGPEAVHAAEQLGFARRRSLHLDDRYPCRSLCSMRLIDDGGLVAVCEHAPARCHDERIADELAFWLEVDLDTVAPSLQRLLGLKTVPYGGGPVHALGSRRLGARAVAFALVPEPLVAVRFGAIDNLVRSDPDRDHVVFTFTESSIPADVPRRIDGVRVEWFGLDEAVTDDGIDLADAWRPSRSRPLFVVDEPRGVITYADLVVPVDPTQRPGKLLIELLRREGEWVARRDLLVALWPGDFGGRRQVALGTLDRRLRDVVSALRAAFAAMNLPDGVRGDPVETRNQNDDTEGAHRILAEPRQVQLLR